MERVGPVLVANELGRAVAEAIRGQNERVEVQDRGAYLRVLARGSCRVTRQSVEGILGRTFRLPSDLELVMPAFRGSLSIDGDQVVWSFREGR